MSERVCRVRRTVWSRSTEEKCCLALAVEVEAVAAVLIAEAGTSNGRSIKEQS